MIIEFGWGSGHMAVDAVKVIHNMPHAKYKEWVKLFAQYGTEKQHMEFAKVLVEERKYARLRIFLKQVLT